MADFCRAHALSRIRLTTIELHSKATALYEHYGFELLKRRETKTVTLLTYEIGVDVKTTEGAGVISIGPERCVEGTIVKRNKCGKNLVFFVLLLDNPAGDTAAVAALTAPREYGGDITSAKGVRHTRTANALASAVALTGKGEEDVPDATTVIALPSDNTGAPRATTIERVLTVRVERTDATHATCMKEVIKVKAGSRVRVVLTSVPLCDADTGTPTRNRAGLLVYSATQFAVTEHCAVPWDKARSSSTLTELRALGIAPPLPPAPERTENTSGAMPSLSRVQESSGKGVGTEVPVCRSWLLEVVSAC